MNLEELLADGSWRLETPEAAEFRLAPDTAGRRGALVQRILGAPEPDPELWESALIEAFLSHPAAAGLRTLRLEMTDFHHSARRAASILGSRPLPALTDLWFGHRFTYLYENATTSSGRTFDPLDHYDEGFAGHAEWQNLTALRNLTVEGALLFHSVSAPAATNLRSHGVFGSDGSVFPSPQPSLTHLELEIATDVFGTPCPVEQLEQLTVESFPALRSLDLGRAEFDASNHEVLATLAELPILAQLQSLRVAGLDPDDDEWTPIAPRFGHLTLTSAD
jgi:hypothetical protein